MLISHFELLPGLIRFASLLHDGYILEKDLYINMNLSFLTTMSERDIRMNTVVTSDGAGKVIDHENF